MVNFAVFLIQNEKAKNFITLAKKQHFWENVPYMEKIGSAERTRAFEFKYNSPFIRIYSADSKYVATVIIKMSFLIYDLSFTYSPGLIIGYVDI